MEERNVLKYLQELKENILKYFKKGQYILTHEQQ